MHEWFCVNTIYRQSSDSSAHCRLRRTLQNVAPSIDLQWQVPNTNKDHGVFIQSKKSGRRYNLQPDFLKLLSFDTS